MQRLTFLISISLLIAISISCGGSATNNGVVENEVSGTFIVTPLLQKTYLKSHTITGVAYDLDNPNLEWPCTIKNDTYSFKMVRRSNVVVKLSAEGVVLMSRVLSREDTDSLTLENIKVNAVTHVHAQMAQKYQSQTPAWSYKKSIESAYKELLGNENPDINDLTVAQVFKTNPFTAAIISSYARLFTAENLENQSDIFKLFNTAFSEKILFSIESSYINQANNIVNKTIADSLASLHEGAKNSKIIHYSAFLDLGKKLTNTTISVALNDVLKSPVFGSDIDSVRITAPATLFQYTFPKAVTEDVLGIANYQGKWIGNSIPTSLIDTTFDEGRTLKWIPSELDEGEIYQYQLDAVGVNGRTASTLKVITVEVKSLEIKAIERKRLPASPILGPLVYKDYMYLIASYSNTTLLQKFKMSDLEVTAPDSLLSSENWTLPNSYSSIYDMKIYNDIVYLALGNTGIQGYDSNWNGYIVEKATYMSNTNGGNISATQIQIVKENIYSISTLGENLASVSSLDLTETKPLDEINTFTFSEKTHLGQIDQTYLYLSNANSGIIYSPNSVGGLAIAKQFTAITDQFFDKNTDSILQSDYLYTQNSAQSVKLIGDQFKIENYTPLQINSFTGLTANGTYFFNAYNSNSVIAQSLTGTRQVIYESGGSSNPVYYSNIPKKLRFFIRNIPEGIDSGYTGSYLYSFGQDISSSVSATWYIKSHKLIPKI